MICCNFFFEIHNVNDFTNIISKHFIVWIASQPATQLAKSVVVDTFESHHKNQFLLLFLLFHFIFVCLFLFFVNWSFKCFALEKMCVRHMLRFRCVYAVHHLCILLIFYRKWSKIIGIWQYFKLIQFQLRVNFR